MIRFRVRFRDKQFDFVVYRQGTIGRNPGVNLCISESPYSREHAKVYAQNGVYWLEDRGSRNGTFYNNQQMTSATQLTVNDSVRICDLCMQVAEITDPENWGNEERIQLGDPALPNAKLEEISISPQPPPPTAAPSPMPEVTGLAELLLTLRDDDPASSYTFLIEQVRRGNTEVNWATLFRTEFSIEDTRRTVPSSLIVVAHSPAGEVKASKKAALLAIHQQKEIDWSQELAGTDQMDLVNSGRYLPLFSNKEAVGVLCVHSRLRSPLSDEYGRFLRCLSRLAALILGREAERSKAEVFRQALRVREPFFSRKVADKLSELGGQPWPGGPEVDVTVLFADVRGFTKLSKEHRPDEIVEILNAYFGRLTPIIHRHEGVVDKFIGDAIVAVFGSPYPDPDQAVHAVDAAWGLQQELSRLSIERQKTGQPTLSMGIGINSGKALHGFIGSRDRMEYTVIGDVINLASRYCDAAIGGEILLSPQSHARAWKRRCTPVERQIKHGLTIPAYVVDGTSEVASTTHRSSDTDTQGETTPPSTPA